MIFHKFYVKTRSEVAFSVAQAVDSVLEGLDGTRMLNFIKTSVFRPAGAILHEFRNISPADLKTEVWIKYSNYVPPKPSKTDSMAGKTFMGTEGATSDRFLT